MEEKVSGVKRRPEEGADGRKDWRGGGSEKGGESQVIGERLYSLYSPPHLPPQQPHQKPFQPPVRTPE